jgi:arsenate reductase-like glutaredoxin family protein
MIVDRGAVGVERRTPDLLTSIQVQIFGRTDSRDTQKALRFFKERRVDVSFVNLGGQRAMAPAELNRFAQRFGASELIDRSSRAYREQGLAYMSLDEAGALSRLLADQSLLRLPLVRAGNLLSVGVDEAAWRAWLTSS